MAQHIIPYGMMPYHIFSCHTISYHIIPYHLNHIIALYIYIFYTCIVFAGNAQVQLSYGPDQENTSEPEMGVGERAIVARKELQCKLQVGPGRSVLALLTAYALYYYYYYFYYH